MSWISMLYETYENCASLVGKVASPEIMPLLPIAHTTQSAHLEITLDQDGNLLGTEPVRVITGKREAVTVIPCTDASAARVGNDAPHPLFDKLNWVAGDYLQFGGDPKKAFFASYLAQLNEWCHSPYRNRKVCAVRDYVQKGQVIADLVRLGIFPEPVDGIIPAKWHNEELALPAIYLAKAPLATPLEAFVRFCVHIPGEIEDRLWLDPSVSDDYAQYYLSTKQERDLCYVTGKLVPCAEKNPAKIRHTGDKAKLISSNDSSGFTYRGRFKKPAQVVRISDEVTQKAHNALKWLIAKQGYRNGDQVYVAWGTKNERIPKAFTSSENIFLEANIEVPRDAGTYSEYVHRLNVALGSYKQDLAPGAQIVVMGVDSATPGRLSIIYYQELRIDDFLRRLQYWYSTCSGVLTYKKDHIFVGTPAPLDIITAAYGDNVNDKMKKFHLARLVPCILNKAPLPRDMVLAVTRRVSRPLVMEDGEYHKALSIACAVIRKYYNDRYNQLHHEGTDQYEEVWSMTLDELSKDRSYLFGRLLAYYHNLERAAQSTTGQWRNTNALRLKNQFTKYPAKTAMTLDKSLDPYISRLEGRATAKLEKMNELISLLQESDQNGHSKFSNQPLEAQFLLGFRSQLDAFSKEKKAKQEEKAHDNQ